MAPTGDVQDEALRELVALLFGKRLAVLTGAGCSTESGIPDYRGPKTRALARNPIQYRAFLRDPQARARYWARSMIGWPKMRDAVPNAAHRSLTDLESAGLLTGLVTQNVDGLHGTAGSRNVIELHGRLREVRCLDCGVIERRDDVQGRLQSLNPHYVATVQGFAPDGDADTEVSLAGFVVPTCEVCGGVLKPAVVFFGESVPPRDVTAANAVVDSADALLVVGSSLAVFSGYRFVKRAHQQSKPIALINLGPTRSDAEVTLHVDSLAGVVVPKLAARLARNFLAP